MRAVFSTRNPLSHYRNRHGQQCEVVRMKRTPSRFPELPPFVFIIRFDDGHECIAFREELLTVINGGKAA